MYGPAELSERFAIPWRLSTHARGALGRRSARPGRVASVFEAIRVRQGTQTIRPIGTRATSSAKSASSGSPSASRAPVVRTSVLGEPELHDDPVAVEPGATQPAGRSQPESTLHRAIAELRHDFDRKLTTEIRRHREEVDALKQELRALREQIGQNHRPHGLSLSAHLPPSDSAGVLNGISSLHDTSTRVLGTALRLSIPALPTESPTMEDAPSPAPFAPETTRLGFVSVATAGPASLSTPPEETWVEPVSDCNPARHAS